MVMVSMDFLPGGVCEVGGWTGRSSGEKGSCCLRNSSSLALLIFRCVAAPAFHTLEEEVELKQWKKKTSKLRTRNVVTGLAIGALVLGIYGYTFYSVSQERIMDEIDEEAKRARLQGPKTGAN
ncbi:hypothetical protein ILYODFUR_003604 [Ilyodon furcidens]|uniref:Cytochrome c oxidase assembly factor 3 n=1 Tax=Ilyodon furcidens TaxID=33524 RepID=A0ABV0STY1_9TELE